MYALRLSGGHELISRRNLQFGDTFALVRDGDEFLRRVTAAGEHLGYTLELQPVSYVDEQKHNGPMGIFRKRSAFSYQNEFRIALIPGPDKSCVLAVGDLSDIVVTGSLEDLNRHLRIDIRCIDNTEERS